MVLLGDRLGQVDEALALGRATLAIIATSLKGRTVPRGDLA